MRSAQKNNRTRGRGNRKSNGNALNRVYDSSGPEGKVRGTPQQIIEKYLSLARDAQTAGDRVTGENFLQHAEHYQRIVIQATAAQNERREGQENEDAEEAQGQPVQPEAHGGAQGAEDAPQPRQPRRREQVNGQPEARSQRAAPEREKGPEASVSSLTTIDTGDGNDGGSLLVATEDVATSQPAPQPRRRRSRAPKADPAAEASEPTAAAEPTPDTAS